ncbi:intraflagellar transport protein 81 homolog, partial [Atheta coriaria]|uniref:intraflagellar transport protein 81 homolog n=1 Tax=Dalotia coriaria TaxID=877792 RepID=UPI0031F37BD3
MYKVYEDTIETFWLKYSENKKEAVFAKETKELEDDIYQMKIELSNLEKRIDAQCKKAELSENLLQETWELLKQRKKFAKLSKQFEEDNAIVQERIDTIRNYNRRDKISSLEELIEKSEYYTDAQQVYVMSLNEINADLKIFEKVATEPSDDDLQQLEEYQETLKHTVNELHKTKDQDDAINAMQNQQRILLKKKSLLSKQILKIRLNNEQVLNKIDELSQILGGEILRGQTFKKYVADLKARCNIYKKNKIYMKSLENEINILNATLKELYDLEPDLKCKTLNSSNNIPEEIRNLSLNDIRVKTLKLHKEHAILLKTCCEEEEKYQKVKDVYSDNLIEFDRKKHEFNVKTGNLMDYIDNLTHDIEKLESLLNLEQEDLQMQENEVEKIQENLI